jgi:hypothetical protein
LLDAVLLPHQHLGGLIALRSNLVSDPGVDLLRVTEVNQHQPIRIAENEVLGLEVAVCNLVHPVEVVHSLAKLLAETSL